MKKTLIISFLALVLNSAYAQNSVPSSILDTTLESAANSDNVSNKTERKKMMRQKMGNMTPEQRKMMMERREKFKSLSPEKQTQLKDEMRRHRAEMRKIVGEDEKAILPPENVDEEGA